MKKRLFSFFGRPMWRRAGAITFVMILMAASFAGRVSAAPAADEPTPPPQETEPTLPPQEAAEPDSIGGQIPEQDEAGRQSSISDHIPWPWTYEDPLNALQWRLGLLSPPSSVDAGVEAAAVAQGVQLLSQTGGTPYGIALQGNYAYVISGNRLLIFNVTTPETPVLAGKTTPWDFSLIDVTVAGNYAYVIGDGSNGLRIVDIANVASPKEVGFFKDIWGVEAAVSGSIIFVVEYDCLKSIDVSTPANPVLLDTYCPVGGNDARLDQEMGYVSAGIAIYERYAFLALGFYGLRIVNILDPANMSEAGGYTPGTWFSDISISSDGNTAFVADGGIYDDYQHKTVESGLRIIDVSDRTSPIQTSFKTSMGIAKRISLNSTFAYIADGNDFAFPQAPPVTTGVEIFDVSNLSDPVSESIFDSEGVEPIELVYNAQNVFLVDAGYGLQVIDVEAPETPKRVGFYPLAGALDVVVSGNYAYLAIGYGGMQIFNVTTPENPIYVGNYDPAGFVRGLTINGQYAYLAAGDDGSGNVDPTNSGVQVVDISTPAAPQGVDFVQTEGEPNAVAVMGKTLYLAVGDNGSGRVSPVNMGLQLFDITTPTDVKTSGFVATTGNPNRLALSTDGNKVYIADGTYSAAGSQDVTGLEIISAADKAHPSKVSFFNTPGAGFDVTVSGNYAYFADGYLGGLRIINISNPQAPAQVAAYDTGGNAFGVAYADNRAYMADGWNGLQVINVADVSKPFLEGYYKPNSPSFHGHLAVVSNIAYVASGSGGFIILKFTGGMYSISGKITDSDNKPVAGATLSAGSGHSTTTNASGEYKLENLPAGTYTITPSIDRVGVKFDPQNRVGKVPPSASGQDFKLIPLTACTNIIKNGDFETDSDWYLPITMYPAGYNNELIQEAAAAYSTEQMFSGKRSLRVGIVDPGKNIYSYSSGWQMVTLPASTTSATLRFWLYPKSVNGIDHGDVQLMILLNNSKVEVQRLVNMRSDTRKWEAYSFDLKKYAGKTIWVYFGVVNNGYAANMAMYVDDVSLEVCTP